jgi:hypothetical protein
LFNSMREYGIVRNNSEAKLITPALRDRDFIKLSKKKMNVLKEL